MSTTTRNIIPAKVAETSQTTQYTAELVRCVIDKMTVTNTSAGNLSISVNLIPASGTAGDGNLIVKARILAPSETYTMPELVGQVIEAGGSISTLASGVGLTIRASGREIG
jgi:hypothetical protein